MIDIHYELHGEGVPLFLGFPLMASHAEIFGREGAALKDAYLERLTPRYRVLLADYPGIGRSATIPPLELTADRVASDLLRVADAAGFDRFVFWGYSWGGSAALQLASRTDRLRALVVGGWSPLGGHSAEAARGARGQLDHVPASSMVVLRDAAQYRQWVTYNESALLWDEARAIASIACPRLVYNGALGDTDVGGVPVPIATTNRERRADLEALGWVVREIPGRDHSAFLYPAEVVPVVRAFLDAVG